MFRMHNNDTNENFISNETFGKLYVSDVTNDRSLSSRTRCFAHARCTVGAITQRLREPIPLARRSLYLVTRASAHPNIRLLIRALAFVTVPTAASRLAYLIFLRLGPMFRLYFPFLHLVNKFKINNVLS